MADPNFGAIHEHADHVKSIVLRVLPVPVDPHHRGTLQLLALAMVNSLDRPAEFVALSRLYLDECHGPIPLDHQIYVAMTATEPALYHAPAAPPKPPLCYSFPEFPERLPCR